jgi:hypothetical protein
MGVGGQRHASAALPQRKGPGVHHCTGGWMGPTAGLNGCGKYHARRDSIPGPSRPANRCTELRSPGPHDSVICKH